MEIEEDKSLSTFRVDPDLTTIHSVDLTTVARAQNHGIAQLHTLLYVEDNPANMMMVEDIIARRSCKNSGVALAFPASPSPSPTKYSAIC